MNTAQRAILVIGLVVFVAAALVPPWTYPRHEDSLAEFAGYHQYFGQPPTRMVMVRTSAMERESRHQSPELDWSRLLVAWIVIATVTGGLLALVSAPSARGERRGANDAP